MTEIEYIELESRVFSRLDKRYFSDGVIKITDDNPNTYLATVVGSNDSKGLFEEWCRYITNKVLDSEFKLDDGTIDFDKLHTVSLWSFTKERIGGVDKIYTQEWIERIIKNILDDRYKIIGGVIRVMDSSPSTYIDNLFSGSTITYYDIDAQKLFNDWCRNKSYYRNYDLVFPDGFTVGTDSF
jgi:hypothetical protein